MTVPSTTSRMPAYVGNGTASNFAFTFEIETADELGVYLIEVATGDETKLARTAHYTVNSAGVSGGGSIDLVNNAAFAWLTTGDLAAGYDLVLLREPSMLQESRYSEAGRYYGDDAEQDLDRAAQRDLYLLDQARRALHLPVGESPDDIDMALPAAIERASRFLSFDAQGKPIVASTLTSSTPATLFIETLLDDADAATARGTLGNLSSVVATIAALKALSGTNLAGTVVVQGYGSAGDGGGGLFRWNSVDASADDAGSIIRPNSAPVTGRWNRISPFRSVVPLAAFGAVGDDTTDDATAIQACLNALGAAGGGIAIASPGATYKCTVAPIVKQRVALDLVGATLHLTLDGNKEGVTFLAGSELRNGTVTLNGTNLTGTGGNWHTPIVIGVYASNGGYDDVRVRDLTLSTDRANGNGVLVTGGSSNITLERLRFPTSTTLGRCVLVHWAGDGATPPALTTHPYNITVRQIIAGAMSANYADQAIVFLSGVYNTLVEHVYADRAKTAMVQCVIGDYGGHYAGATIQPLIGNGIRIRGVVGKLCNGYGVYIDSWADNYSGAPIDEMPVVVEDCYVVGDGTSGTIAGFRTVKQKGATFRNCTATLFVWGADIDESCERVAIIGGRFFANRAHGVVVDHPTHPPKDCRVENVQSYGNGTDGGAGNCAGVYIGAATRTAVTGNRLGDPTNAETTQYYGIRVLDTAVDTTVVGNHVQDVKATGVCYGNASGGVFGPLFLFRDNGVGDGVTGADTITGGMEHLPQRRTPGGAAKVNVHYLATNGAAPAAGTHVRGDTYTSLLPSSGGAEGGVCVVDGGPGTWKNAGSIA